MLKYLLISIKSLQCLKGRIVITTYINSVGKKIPRKFLETFITKLEIENYR